MKIEAVIICHEYSDFLAHTLPTNLNHLDKIIVVTTPEDKATMAVCNKYSIQCVDTRVFFEDGDIFNKGRAINLGLSNLRHDDWLLHLDADILLPDRFRGMLNQHILDRDVIYGADRLHSLNWEHFNKHHNNHHFKYNCKVEPPREFPVGGRLVPQHYGYTPIGYFQLWHSSRRRQYPISAGSAEHSDVMFAVQWDRDKRRLLPEVFVTHLESESGEGLMSQNWKGRKSKSFCPCHPHHHKHHHHHHPHPYCPK